MASLYQISKDILDIFVEIENQEEVTDNQYELLCIKEEEPVGQPEFPARKHTFSRKRHATERSGTTVIFQVGILTCQEQGARDALWEREEGSDQM